MNYIKIRYKGAAAEASLQFDTASGQINTLRAQFEFSPDWDAYSLRTAVFAGSGITAAVLLEKDNSCTVPAAVLEHCGQLSVGAFANAENGSARRYVGQPDSVYIPCGVSTDAANPPPDDPTLYEQLLARLVEKLDANQGTKNAGRALVVGEDGIVRPGEYASSGGGGESGVEIDTTLTQSGKAADAKAVGDALAGKQPLLTDADKTEIAEEAAALVDAALLATIGTGEVTA